MIDNALHREQKIRQHEPLPQKKTHKKGELEDKVNSGAPEG